MDSDDDLIDDESPLSGSEPEIAADLRALSHNIVVFSHDVEAGPLTVDSLNRRLGELIAEIESLQDKWCS